MTKVTYVGGEDDGNAGTVSMAGVVFPLNKAVEVTDQRMLGKLAGNRFFDIEGINKPPIEERNKPASKPEDEADDDTDDSGVRSTASRSSRMRR